VQALKKELEKLKVRLIYQTAVVDLAVEKNRISGVIDHRHKFMPAERVVLATGGVSYPFTGSTGEGLSIARKFGHRVTELSPALVPLEAQEDFLRQLKGLTLKNIRLRFCDGKEEIRSEIGELLFSESGISGPLVLSLSSTVAQWLKHSQQVYAVIDLKPALSPEELDQRLLRELRLNSRKAFKNMLKGLLPQRLIEVFVMILGIDRHKLCSYITQQERQCLGRLLKNLRLRISSTRPIEEAMVTRGGLSLKDINPRTMESRLIKGLYFCGEMIDVDADTGGFNLQAAFSTGYLAGESAAINFSDPTIRLRSG
jgi:predicted Rossmann fold flavoprotein